MAINSTAEECNRKGRRHKIKNENALEKARKRLEESVMREILNTIQENPPIITLIINQPLNCFQYPNFDQRNKTDRFTRPIRQYFI